tara:strand:- start:1142 stop:1462 length:321 start_codon:yes stop_codon:yes gene_type:complete
MTRSKWTIALDKYDLPDKKKSTLSKFFDVDMDILDDVYDRGLAAARNTGTRQSVTSDDQWARARMNKLLIRIDRSRKGKKIKDGRGQDVDLILKALNKKKSEIVFI